MNDDQRLLPRRRLQYSWTDTRCSAKDGLKATAELLGGANRIDAVVGPGCSSACEVVSHLAAGRQPGLAQISYSCTAASLSDKEQHHLVSPVSSLSRPVH